MNRLLVVLAVLCCISGYLYSQQATAAVVASDLSKRHASGNHHQDPRWRLISAMLVLKEYSAVMANRYDENERPVLLHINSESLLLKNILRRVCNLVAFDQLAININDTTDSRDFYPLLSEIITDACEWLQYMVRQGVAITPGENSNFYNCSAGSEMTLLHHFCYRMNIANLIGIVDVADFALHSYITEYYSGEYPPVPGANFTRWLDTSSLPLSIRNSIHENTVIALLQYIIKTKL
jgi:hypothetical protein